MLRQSTLVKKDVEYQKKPHREALEPLSSKGSRNILWGWSLNPLGSITVGSGLWDSLASLPTFSCSHKGKCLVAALQIVFHPLAPISGVFHPPIDGVSSVQICTGTRADQSNLWDLLSHLLGAYPDSSQRGPY